MAKQELDERFKKFGTVSFTATSKVNDFIDALENGKVSGTMCPQCGLHFFPPRADCCQCLGNDMQWFEITETGKLITYTHMQYGPVGFENDLPYSIAVLDFDKYKVFGRISPEEDIRSISLGEEMYVEPYHHANGQISYVFKRK
jgi:hypothetical protein